MEGDKDKQGEKEMQADCTRAFSNSNITGKHF
jgi:hypothetical protein